MWDKTRKSYTFPPSSSPLPFSSSMGTALSRSVPSSRSIKKLFRLPFVSRVMNRIDPLEIARTWNTIGKRPKEPRSFFPLSRFAPSLSNRHVSPIKPESFTFVEEEETTQLSSGHYERFSSSTRERVKESSIVTVLEQGCPPPNFLRDSFHDPTIPLL